MSQSVLTKHADLRKTLDPRKSLTDGNRVWTDAFCEVYDELEKWVGIVDQNHGVKEEWEEFRGTSLYFDDNPNAVVNFLAWLVRRVNAI